MRCFLILILGIYVPYVTPQTTKGCALPPEYIKKLYAIEDGMKTKVLMGKDNKLRFLKETSSSTTVDWPKDLDMTTHLEGTCYDIIANNTGIARSAKDLIVVFRNPLTSCTFCFHFYHRSANVLEYQHSPDCNNMLNPTRAQLTTLCNGIEGTTIVTGFVEDDTYTPYNCKKLFEGIYHFSYELNKAYGECNNRKSLIRACQATGSSLRDNNIFEKREAWCPGLSTDGKAVASGTKDEKWKCYGVWTDPNGNIKAGIQLDNVDDKFRYRCLITTIDQQVTNNERRWGMTTTSDCSKLKNDYSDAEYRLKLKPSLDEEIQLPFLKPGCNLPKAYTGYWFFPGEYNTDVTINSTHMVHRRMKNEFEYEDVIYSCRQAQENRYLMATVAVGRCEMDFICFHFVPRHHNIIRFRTSRPFRYFAKHASRKNYMVELFREACHWNSFTLNNRRWNYQYFILNPPVPVNCPVQGRFTFVQTGDISEKYTTKIPGGVTIRPRVQILCDSQLQESDLAICTSSLKTMLLDVQRCMALDHTGRPTSEYDIQDNTLTCVGYWMEDTKSFLITYDPDDPVSQNFRCWVYRRLSFHTYVMSRSAGSHCRPEQTALSNRSEDGVSLHLELHSNEREFDGCPMAFDDGKDPFKRSSALYVYSSARETTKPSVLFFTTLGFLMCCFMGLPFHII